MGHARQRHDCSIVHVDGEGWVISVNRVWRPGVYDSEDAAHFACEAFCDCSLRMLQDRVAPAAVTLAQLLNSVRADERICRQCRAAQADD